MGVASLGLQRSGYHIEVLVYCGDAVMALVHQPAMSSCGGRMVSASDSQPQIVGSSPTRASWLIKNRPAWATTGDDNMVPRFTQL